jgi:hypothetical protein
MGGDKPGHYKRNFIECGPGVALSCRLKVADPPFFWRTQSSKREKWVQGIKYRV